MNFLFLFFTHASVIGQIYSSIPAYSVCDTIPVYLYGAEDTQTQVERTIKESAKIVGSLYGISVNHLIEELRKTKVEIYVRKGEYVPCADVPQKLCLGFMCDVEGWCDGLYTRYPKRIDYIKHDCIGDSALAHELIHLLLDLIKTDMDSTHRQPKLYPNACVPIVNIKERNNCYRNSAERRIQRKIRKLFCKKPQPTDSPFVYGIMQRKPPRSTSNVNHNLFFARR